MGSLANSLGELRWCMWHTACFNMVLTSTASISVPSVAPRDCACPCGLYLLPSIAAELLVLALVPALWVATAAVLLVIPHTDIWVSGSALASTVIAYCRGLFLGRAGGCCALRGASDSGGASLGLRRARLSGRNAAPRGWVGSGAASSGGRAWGICARTGSLCRTTTSLGVLLWSRHRGPAEFWDPSHPCLEHV